MTPARFKSIIEDDLKLSQLAAARLLGIDGRTCRRYIRGDLPVPPPLARLLAYIEKYGVELAREFVERERNGNETATDLQHDGHLPGQRNHL